MQPIGDPAAMRAAAAALRLRAERIVDVAQRINGAAESAVYEGPAADRFRDATWERRDRLTVAADRVHGVADALARAAAEVYEAQLAAAREAARDAAGDAGECA